MAKAKFEREDIIAKSKEHFWQNGYSSSSMQQIVKATGLKPGSLYNSFGNKETLYGEALENYTSTRLVQMKQKIDKAPSTLLGICAVVEDLILQSIQKDYCSCFLIKTQFEISEKESKLHDQAVSGLELVEELLRDYLVREYGEEIGPIRATSVMLNMNGIRVYSYRKNALDRMRRGVREGLGWLPWDEFDDLKRKERG
jgi:TetR/AcrR family transcriptional regulator, transcriptional repressor for nem operon